MTWDLHRMDCRLAMSMLMEPDSLDACVTDPPYELAFMGRRWDASGIAFDADVWRQTYRVLKPGGHLLAFGGTRTYHRMTCAIEDAGFEIRDCISWNYGSGFPKSLNISKASGDIRFEGWGTALKPSWEPAIIARKPLSDETERHITLANLFQLEARLWLLFNASDADSLSTSSQAEQHVASLLVSAEWNADELLSTLADLCDGTATLWSASDMGTALNTVSSWRRTLDVLSKLPNTSTTGTTFDTTTDWKTLRLCGSAITLPCIMKVTTGRAGGTADASIAARYFSAELSRLTAILELSALAPAIARSRIVYPDADATTQVEPIVLARKPLAERTVAANVLTHGTGGLNVDGCRVEGGKRHPGSYRDKGFGDVFSGPSRDRREFDATTGRFPPNVLHDGSDEVLACFPDSNAGTANPNLTRHPSNGVTYGDQGGQSKVGHGDSGSAARFFPSCALDDEDVATQRVLYCAKASRADRNEGCEAFPERDAEGAVSANCGSLSKPRANHHPTVKPTALMRWLVRLVTPPGGTVLDPFAGSGSTGKAALLEGFNFIGCEMTDEYADIAEARLIHAAAVARGQ